MPKSNICYITHTRKIRKHIYLKNINESFLCFGGRSQVYKPIFQISLDNILNFIVDKFTVCSCFKLYIGITRLHSTPSFIFNPFHSGF